MTADVGLDVYLRYDHRRNLEDVRALACRQGLRGDVIHGQIRTSAWMPLSKEAPSSICDIRLMESEDEPKRMLDREVKMLLSLSSESSNLVCLLHRTSKCGSCTWRKRQRPDV
jgi:hypothetical protein